MIKDIEKIAIKVNSSEEDIEVIDYIEKHSKYKLDKELTKGKPLNKIYNLIVIDDTYSCIGRISRIYGNYKEMSYQEFKSITSIISIYDYL